MSAQKSQMFFARGENFFHIQENRQNFIDKPGGLWFNVFKFIGKDVDGKLVLMRVFQRADGWCESVHSIWTIWFLSWPCESCG